VITLDILCNDGHRRRYSRNDQTPLNYRSQRSVYESTWNSIRIPTVSETANRPVVPASGSRVRLHFPDIFRSFSSVPDGIQRDVKAHDPFFSLVAPFPRYEPLCAKHCFIRINCAPISCRIQPEGFLICPRLIARWSVTEKNRNEETRSEGKRCAGMFLDNRLDDLPLTWIHYSRAIDLPRSFDSELIEEMRGERADFDIFFFFIKTYIRINY